MPSASAIQVAFTAETPTQKTHLYVGVRVCLKLTDTDTYKNSSIQSWWKETYGIKWETPGWVTVKGQRWARTLLCFWLQVHLSSHHMMELQRNRSTCESRVYTVLDDSYSSVFSHRRRVCVCVCMHKHSVMRDSVAERQKPRHQCSLLGQGNLTLKFFDI